MEQEEAERNMQILLDFLHCLRKQKVDELKEVCWMHSISFLFRLNYCLVTNGLFGLTENVNYYKTAFLKLLVKTGMKT